jgi:hypothetical protein
MSAGIDYGLGRTNVDRATGIRYGVISMHDIFQAWSEESEADYGEPTCPKCGGDVVESHMINNDGERWPRLYSHSVEDYACENCEHYLDSSDVFGEEPYGWYVDDGEYHAINCLDSDVMLLKSPFYTFTQFCSPCVPGAGNLNSSDPDGVKTYCFGPDWFEDEKAPYTIYRVADDMLVNGDMGEE